MAALPPPRRPQRLELAQATRQPPLLAVAAPASGGSLGSSARSATTTTTDSSSHPSSSRRSARSSTTTTTTTAATPPAARRPSPPVLHRSKSLPLRALARASASAPASPVQNFSRILASQRALDPRRAPRPDDHAPPPPRLRPHTSHSSLATRAMRPPLADARPGPVPAPPPSATSRRRRLDAAGDDDDDDARWHDSLLLRAPPPLPSSTLGDPSFLDERAMHRHLLDIESSFVPDPPSAAHAAAPRPAHAPSFHSRIAAARNPPSLSSPPSPSLPAPAPSSLRASALATRRTAAASAPPEHFHRSPRSSDRLGSSQPLFPDASQSARTSSHLGSMSFSSPLTQAAHRQQSRGASLPRPLDPPFGESQETEMHASQEALFDDLDDPEDDAPRTRRPLHETRSVGNLQSSAPPAPASDPIDFSFGDSTTTSTTTTPMAANPQAETATAEQVPSPEKLRPKINHKHKASLRSSASSYAPSEGMASVAETFESAEGSPGTKSIIHGPELSRIPSLGSIASSISNGESALGQNRLSQDLANQNRGESTLNPIQEEKSEMTTPKTPAAGKKSNDVSEPPHTLLNAHVQNVQVPDTVKRDFQSATKAPAADSTDATPLFGRAKGPLTLKEQNSRIDKLSKENFDLKLKIHYLYQALENRSEEGVKDLVTRNAQLQTDLIKSKKETQNLKKRIKELERIAGYRGQAPSTTPSRYEESEGESSRDFQQTQLEEEIVYLRDCVQHLEKENDKLNQDSVTREFEKRRLAEQIRNLDSGLQSKNDEVWKDLLTTETARREQVEQQVRALHAELAAFKSELSSRLKKQLSLDMLSPRSRLRKDIGSGEDADDIDGSTQVPSSAGTLEQLRQENANLRRDLGAQTSMLTSRNRERERLQQEIEDLKLLYRRGDGPRSIAGDSILERSVSRNFNRPTSRGGASSKHSGLSDEDREHYEALEATLRDENSFLRLRNQDLQRDLDHLMDSAEHIENLRAERDEAIRLGDEDREYAANAIDGLELQLEEKEGEIRQLSVRLGEKEAEAEALQQELRDITDSLNRVVDDAENSQSTIQGLQEDLTNATAEIEALEQSLRDANEEKERLEVQAESSQNEISFLREEQETDKIKLSDLETALRTASHSAQSDKERVDYLEKIQDDLALAQDEVRTLRRDMESVEAEGETYRDRFAQLETRLREVTGLFDGNDSSLLQHLLYLKDELEEKAKELQKTRHALELRDVEYDDISYQLSARETELRTHQQASREFKDALDRERRARKGDQDAHERAVASLKDMSVASGKGASFVPDYEYERKLTARNDLLLTAYERLAALCGNDWAKRHNIKSPNLGEIGNSLAAVDEPLRLAIQAIESTLSSFRSRVRNTERDIKRDYAALEATLNSRSRRIEALEKLIKSSAQSSSASGQRAPPPLDEVTAAENSRLRHDLSTLRTENKSLRKELQYLKDGVFALPGLPAPSTDLQAAQAAAAAIERERRQSVYDSPADDPDTTALARTHGHHGQQLDGPVEPQHDAALVLRAQELERRLRNEREARLLDRTGARKRLEEGQREKDDLRRELDRMRGQERIAAIGGGTNGTQPSSRSVSDAWPIRRDA